MSFVSNDAPVIYLRLKTNENVVCGVPLTGVSLWQPLAVCGRRPSDNVVISDVIPVFLRDLELSFESIMVVGVSCVIVFG